MTRRMLALLGAASLLSVSTLAAQETPPPGGRPPMPRAEGQRVPRRPAPVRPRMDRRPGADRRPMGIGPRGGMAMSPARALLGMRERLDLTEDQVRRLEALATSQRAALRPNEPAMLRARADLAEAMQRDNLDGVRTAMERMSRVRIDATIARLQARRQAREILTAEQRARLEEPGPVMRRRRQ